MMSKADCRISRCVGVTRHLDGDGDGPGLGLGCDDDGVVGVGVGDVTGESDAAKEWAGDAWGCGCGCEWECGWG